MTIAITNQDCRVCYRPAIASESIINSKEIDGVMVGEDYYYCSSVCRYTDKRKRMQTFAGVMILIATIFILLKSYSWGLLISFVGVIALGYSFILYPKIDQQYDTIHSNPSYYVQNETGAMDLEGLDEVERELEEMDQNEIAITDMIMDGPNPNNDVTQILNPDNSKQVYSKILAKYVDPCCYQTARLDDKYCMCGKAIEYPTET